LATFLPTEGFAPGAEPRPVTVQIVALLNRRLSDAIDLESRCREAEWNSRAIDPALSELFGDLRRDAACFGDTLASRIVELGGMAEGTPHVVAQRSGLLEILPTASSIDPMLRPVNAALTSFASRIRIAVTQTSRLDDGETSAICARISRDAENGLRRLKGHRAEPS
jgi:starvation-inducible DNA-binding protein